MVSEYSLDFLVLVKKIPYFLCMQGSVFEFLTPSQNFSYESSLKLTFVMLKGDGKSGEREGEVQVNMTVRNTGVSSPFNGS